MNHEIEVKLRVGDPDAVRRRLAEVGRVAKPAVREDNVILDNPQRELLKAGCGLRVRRTVDDAGQTACVLTFKGPVDPQQAKAGVRSREEIETEVADADALLLVFARLGLTPKIRYEKRRETWQVGECEVVLDEMPKLGWFVEIEAPDVDTLRQVQGELALADSAVVGDTYVKLTADRGATTTDGGRELVFGD